MVLADRQENRLLIRFPVKADEHHLQQLLEDMQTCIGDLSPGFEAVADMSQCNVVFLCGLEIIKKMMDCLVSNRVGEVVSVNDDGKVSYKQINRFMEGIQCYKTCPASSLEEAEQKLKSFTTRSGIRFKLNRPAVKFRLDDEAVKRGHVVDISISGCAIETEAGTPAYGDELLVTVYFADHPDFLSSFETQAKVVRTDDRVFAVQFVDVASQYQEQLYERLAHESGSSMVCPC